MEASQENTRPVVLLVEDSPGDIRLMREAFIETNKDVDLRVVTDGMDAMDFLKQLGAHSKAPRPDLILLDLNLPKKDGREVLALIKGDNSLQFIPTVILTTSDDEGDVRQCYQLQTNSYLCKPVDLNVFEALVGSINNYWLTKARLVSH